MAPELKLEEECVDEDGANDVTCEEEGCIMIVDWIVVI